tara:strand:- start:597 stop:833 length:237 start_codon:yes stop_codon:yes gene_type:complete
MLVQVSLFFFRKNENIGILGKWPNPKWTLLKTKKHTFVRIWDLFAKIPTFFVCHAGFPMDVFVSYGPPVKRRQFVAKK